jgi:hypothetical protein
MKETFTQRVLVIFLTGLIFLLPLNAQQTIVKTVGNGGDYATVYAALNAITNTDDLLRVAGDSIALLLKEGTIIEPTTPNKMIQNATGGNRWVIRVPLKIYIKGEGADKTTLSGSYPDTDGRLWQAGNGLAGASITFENLSFKNFGSDDTNVSGANGGIINSNNASATGQLILKFKNVIFADCGGRSLFNLPSSFTDIYFDNCLFINNKITPSTDATNNGIQGMINRISGGVLSISNTTFYSNQIIPGTTSLVRGAVINVSPGTGLNTSLILSNNAFVNNQVQADANDQDFQGKIAIMVPGQQGTYTINMNNNIMVGNSRTGKPKDVDLFFDSLVVTIPSGSGNIINDAVEKTGDGPEFSYTRPVLTGFKLDPTYTYTDSRINFTMEGQLPKLTNDGFAIGHVAYTGNGGSSTVAVNPVKKGSVTIFAQNNVITIDGLKSATTVEVYNITGKLVRRITGASDRAEITMAEKGLYIVRAGTVTQKIVVY